MVVQRRGPALRAVVLTGAADLAQATWSHKVRFVGDPEMVFKFRHPDMQTAAEIERNSP